MWPFRRRGFDENIDVINPEECLVNKMLELPNDLIDPYTGVFHLYLFTAVRLATGNRIHMHGWRSDRYVCHLDQHHAQKLRDKLAEVEKENRETSRRRLLRKLLKL